MTALDKCLVVFHCVICQRGFCCVDYVLLFVYQYVLYSVCFFLFLFRMKFGWNSVAKLFQGAEKTWKFSRCCKLLITQNYITVYHSRPANQLMFGKIYCNLLLRWVICCLFRVITESIIFNVKGWTLNGLLLTMQQVSPVPFDRFSVYILRFRQSFV